MKIYNEKTMKKAENMEINDKGMSNQEPAATRATNFQLAVGQWITVAWVVQRACFPATCHRME